MRPLQKHSLIRALLQGLTLFLASGLFIFYLYVHNFDAVIPHQVYRGHQYTGAQLKDIISKYEIKSVLNLRGLNPDSDWYKQEIAASSAIKYYDVALSSQKLPPIATLQTLVTTIQDAPRPLFVHCLSGNDRSGLASAIALLLTPHISMDEIEKQVSFRYFVLKDDSVGKQVLRLYNCWLKQKNFSTSPKNFLAWQSQLNPANYPDPACL